MKNLKTHTVVRHNVQTSNDNIFVSVDSVYYKCACDSCWRGPTVVLSDISRDFVRIKLVSKIICFSLTQSYPSHPDGRGYGAKNV